MENITDIRITLAMDQDLDIDECIKGTESMMKDLAAFIDSGYDPLVGESVGMRLIN